VKIHEYQAKELLKAYGLPIPSGYLATTAAEAKEAARHYDVCFLKAQIHSGGRGKAGGVRTAKGPEEADELARAMLGMTLVTNQTGPAGKVVRRLLVTEPVTRQAEFYLSVTGDSERAGLLIVASADGGTEIEETAKHHPERIIQVPVSVITGFVLENAKSIAAAFGLNDKISGELTAIMAGMVKLYLDKDCSLIEINPLALTDKGHLLCLDAKITFDDNALFRHPEVAALRDINEEDPKEYQASRHGLSYVTLDGDIGCLVNGAGLAMATMDTIKNYGGNPANFLDVGGTASTEKVKAAFEILLSDPDVKAIFINIFGGIMKCDIIANGVVEAAKMINVKIPIVVRLEGTNVELGRDILRQSGLAIIAATDMADGAKKAIKAAHEVSR